MLAGKRCQPRKANNLYDTTKVTRKLPKTVVLGRCQTEFRRKFALANASLKPFFSVPDGSTHPPKITNFSLKFVTENLRSNRLLHLKILRFQSKV